METQWTLKPPRGQLTLCSLTPPDTTQLLKREVREEGSRPRPGPESSVGMCPVSAHGRQATHCPLGARGVKPESQGRGPGSPAKGTVRSSAAGEASVRGGPGRLTAEEGGPGRCARPQAQGDSRPASQAGRPPAGATSCSPRGCPAQAFPWPRSRTHSPVTRQSWVPLTLFNQGTLCQDRQRKQNPLRLTPKHLLSCSCVNSSKRTYDVAHVKKTHSLILKPSQGTGVDGGGAGGSQSRLEAGAARPD